MEYEIYDVNSDTNEDQHTRKQRLNAEREKAELARLNQIRLDAERRVHESFLLAQQEAAAKAAEEKKERERVESKLRAKQMRIESQKMSMNFVEHTIQMVTLPPINTTYKHTLSCKHNITSETIQMVT